MNNDTFLIEESDLELAKSICNKITDKKLRNRSYRNILASKIAKQYFTEIELDVNSGLHNIGKVLEQIDISDVYINGSYIDVRLYFDADEILVPKQHFDNDLLPVAYMFIKVDEELSSAMVSGFIAPENINQQLIVDNYFKLEEDDLQSFYDIESLIETNYDEPEENIENLILNYIENSYVADNEFYIKLLKSESSRTLLIDCAKADNILKKVFVSNDFVQQNDEEAAKDTVMEIDNTSEEEPEILNNDFKEALEPTELLEESSNDFELSMNNEENLLEQFDTETVDLTESSTEEDSELILFEESEEIEENETPQNIEETLNTNESSEEILEIIEETDSNETNLDIISEIEEPLLEFSERAEESNETMDNSNELKEPIDSEETSIDIIDNIELESDVENDFESTFEVDAETDAQKVNNVDEETISEIAPVDFDLIEELDSLIEEQDNDYSTTTTPSLETIENGEIENLTEEDLMTVEENLESNNSEAIGKTVENEQLDNLFSDDTVETEFQEENVIEPKHSNKSGLLVIPFVIIILGLVIYYASKFVDISSFINKSPELPQTTSLPKKEPVKTMPKDNNVDSMPIETVENVPTEKVVKPKETKPNLIIEQNLNTPVSVENLTVNWEVPSSYVSNTTAKRYLSRIGKIIQLNLKADLLLQNKSPITNKIMVELEFNKTAGSFNVKSLIASSGEETIDNMIIDTVKNVLDMNLKTNMTIFGSMSGNPVLVIRL